MSLDQNDSQQRNHLPSPPDDGAEAGFDTVGFLMRRKWLIAFGLMVGLGLGYLYFVKQPAAYQSSGRVLVVKQMSQMPISGGMTLDPMLRQRDHLANDMFLIRSKDIVGPAADENKLGELPTLRRSANPVDTIIRGLVVTRVDDSADLLEVRYTGPYPDDCADIVNAVLRSYRQHLQKQFLNANNETVKLLTEAKSELNTQLEAVAEEYREFRKNADASLLIEGNSATNVNLSYIQSTNGKIAELQIQQRGIEGKLKAIDMALQRGGSREALRLMIDQTSATEEGSGNASGAVMSMARELFPLLMEEELLLESHGPEHPKVQSIRKKIEVTRNFLQDQGLQQNGGARKPVDFLQVYIDSLKLEMDSLQSEEAELRTLMAEQTAASKALGDLELQHTDLIDRKARLQKLFDTVLTKLDDVNLAVNNGGYYAEIISPAGRGFQVAPNLAKIMTMGGVLGALCGLLLGYVVESADQSFKSPEEISQLLHLQIIGHCPLITSSGRARDGVGDVDQSVVTFYKPKSRAAEAFRAIRTALYFSTRGAAHKVIQITSPHPGDGKSTLSSNLAVTIAQSGKRVVIIDADFRRPRVHKIFGVNNETGISSAIAGEVDIMDAVQQTPVAGLDCLACGPRPDNPSELLTSARFDQLLSLLKEKYDFVLVDTPPVLAVTDPSAVAARVDGVLLCIRVNNKSRLDAIRATEMLTQLDANILGIVVNGIDGSTRSKYGYGSRGYYRAGHMYGYGYGYGYGMSDEAAHPSHAKYFADDREPSTPNSRRERARS